MLKEAPKPKVATIVHQNPRSSHSFSKVQDSIAVQRRRAHLKGPSKGNTPLKTPIRTAGPPSRRRSSSFTSSNCKNKPDRIVNIEALVFPHLHQVPGELERIQKARAVREMQYDLEEQKERELKQFEMEFGINPHYKGKKSYEREVNPNGFALIKPEKRQKKWF
jgi:hypothetical protein